MLSKTRQAGLRRRLVAERQRLTTVIRQLDAEIQELGADEATEHATVGNHQADSGSEVFEQESAVTLERNERELLRLVEQALERLAQGQYGRCLRCGEPIAEERLLALPYVAHCLPCQVIVEHSHYPTARRRSAH
jgi:DnaK suppressor protein